MDLDQHELAYYRSVEDHFSGLRGVPHILSPKDFQLLRQWWRDQIPLPAVLDGITEVFTRRRDRGEEDPVVSLTFCRHAVKRQARHLAEARVGEPGKHEAEVLDSADLRRAVNALAERLEAVASDMSNQLEPVQRQIERVAATLRASPDLPPAATDEHLFGLEAGLLERCWEALPQDIRHTIEEVATAAATESGAIGEALQRSSRAVRDRELRRLLDLPRLEIQ